MKKKIYIILIIVILVLVLSMYISQRSWQTARKANDVSAYENYLKKFPLSTHAKQAHAVIDSLKIIQDIATGNVDSYFASSPNVPRRIELIGKIENGYYTPDTGLFLIGFQFKQSSFAMLTDMRTTFKNIKVENGGVLYDIGAETKYRIRGRITKPGELDDGQLIAGQHYFIADYVELINSPADSTKKK
jgi:hypothetical protein